MPWVGSVIEKEKRITPSGTMPRVAWPCGHRAEITEVGIHSWVAGDGVERHLRRAVPGALEGWFRLRSRP